VYLGNIAGASGSCVKTFTCGLHMFFVILFAIIERFTVMPVKISVILNATPCSLLEVYPDDGGSQFLLYFCTRAPRYTASRTRRQ
jgi:hypothetical protein